MVSPSYTPFTSSTSSTRLSLNPPYLSTSSLRLTKFFSHGSKTQITLKRNIKRGLCRAEWSHDAPFAAAIGVCLLSSLVLPTGVSTEENESDSAFDSTDARLAAMAIISFIPYFNWLSWVFAWLDTGKRRYALYAVAYLVPYLRSNLSLPPEESWLPISAIIICIIHVQLEVSIKNGDINGFQSLNEAAKFLSSMTRKKETLKGHEGPYGEGRGEHRDLPSVDKRPCDDEK